MAVPRPKPLEFQRISRLRELFADSVRAEIGIGDDTALLRPHSAGQLLTVDASVEHVHFERAWMSLDIVAFRAFMAAASDIAAMGGAASVALCAWTLPSELEEADIDALGSGTQRAASACDCAVVGGNLTASSVLSLTTTVLGTPHGAAVVRGGGRAQDALFVSGATGAARIGLEALRQGDATPVLQPFRDAFVSPRARLDLGAAIAQNATAAIDLSDGLLPDLAHMCEASELGAKLDLASLPKLPGQTEAAHALGLDPVECLLAGGEDYQLLFAAPSGTQLAGCTQIGELTDAFTGIRVLEPCGEAITLPSGFEHFVGPA